MCGTIVDASSTPAMCEACGGDEFALLPFDAKCKMCGLEYYKDDNLKECPGCGYSFAPPKPPPPPPRPRSAGRAAPSSRSGSRRGRGTSAGTAAPPTTRRRTVTLPRPHPPPAPSYTPPPSSSGPHVSFGAILGVLVKIALFAGLIALIVWAWPIVSVILGIIWFLIKAIFWAICLPFKILGWLFG